MGGLVENGRDFCSVERRDRNEKFNWESKLFLTFASFNAEFSRNYVFYIFFFRFCFCSL